MSRGRVFQLPVPRFSARTSKRTGNLRHELLIEQAAIRVRKIPVDLTSVEMVAKWSNDYTCEIIAWRHFEGALWRPVLNPKGSKIESIDSFLEQASNESILDWMDYPFQATQSFLEQLRRQESEPLLNRNGLDSYAEFAHENLLEVDNLLYKRSLGPVWSTFFETSEGLDPKQRLVLQDYPGHEEGIQSFRPDDWEAANEFSSFASEELITKEYRISSNYNVFTNFQFERISRHVETSDERCESFKRTAKLVKSKLNYLRIGEVPAVALDAYLDILGSSRLADCEVGSTRDGQGTHRKDILCKFIEAAKDTPTLLRALIYCELQKLREEFEERRTDTEALSAYM